MVLKSNPSNNTLYARNRRAERLEQGLCAQCGGPQDRGKPGVCLKCFAKTQTPEAKQKAKEYREQRYVKLIETNTCRHCQTAPASEDSVLCEECLVYGREKYYTNKADGLCVNCRKAPAEDGKITCKACTIVRNEKARISNAAIKDEVYEAYGGYVCTCCGETLKEGLSLDHVNNDGAKHRREIFNGRATSTVSMYRWLRANDYPDMVQVLCAVCNQAKELNGGVCPHVQQRADLAAAEALCSSSGGFI